MRRPPFRLRKARQCDEAVDVDVEALRCDAGRDETGEPIEINLNINIRQEVVVRLQQDVRDLIKENPGVF
jgi:hypothetical protein